MLCISGTFEEYRRHGCGYSGCLYAGKGSECALQRDCNRKSNSDSDLVAAFCVSTFIVVGMISKALLGVVGNLDPDRRG